MADKVFVDTNVLVYAFDSAAGDKQHTARELVTEIWALGTGCLSVQVLQEFFVAVTRRVPQPLSAAAAADIVKDFSTWTVFAPRAEDVLEAIALHQRAQVSLWDALVLHAAAELGCATLWSEDLNPGQRVRGVRIRNPFAAGTGTAL